jgi:PEP-CTERM motif
MKNLLRNTIAATLLLAGVIQHASADIVTVTGDTTNGSTFALPIFNPGPDTLIPVVAYQAFDVVTTGEWLSDWGYTFMTNCEFACSTILYSGSFDPDDEFKHLMTYSDDVGLFSSMETFLEPGKHYTLVVTGYLENESGAFSITAGGQNAISISPVPEPSTGLMLLGGLAGIGALARRRAASATTLPA